MTFTIALLLVIILVLLLVIMWLASSHVRALAQIPAHTRAVVAEVAGAFRERQVIVHVHPQPAELLAPSAVSVAHLGGIQESEKIAAGIRDAIRGPSDAAPADAVPQADGAPPAGEMGVAG